MRLPFSKIYRAFAELDRFSDAECAGFVRTAEKANALASACMTIVMVASIAPCGCIGGGLGIYLAHRLVGDPGEPGWPMTAGLALLTLGVTIPSMSGLWIRDVWLRNVVRKQLNRCTCPGCGYSLLGLIPSQGHAVCPECGTRHSLMELGLSTSDILVPMLDPLPQRGPMTDE